MVTFHSTRLERTTTASFSCHDISADLQAFVDATGIRNGLLVAAGQHTTTALVVNEAEDRLLGDIERHFLALTPPERAYAAFLSGQWNGLDSALLAPHYRAMVQAGPEQTARLQALPDPLARLVAASVLLKKGLISPADIQLALDTASAQGWRRPLLAWLGLQLQRAQAVDVVAK